MGTKPSPKGYFVGLSTFDAISYVDRIPAPNQKATANMQVLAGGGPALNAAVVFAALGGNATLITGLGDTALAGLVRADLRDRGVHVIDVAPSDYPLALSMIAVDAKGGRQIISPDAAATIEIDCFPDQLLGKKPPAVMLLDGHHPNLARTAVKWMGNRAPVLLDAGRWREVFTDLLPAATHIIASEDFHLPQNFVAEGDGLLSSLHDVYPALHLAQSRGGKPLLYRAPGTTIGSEKSIDIPVRPVICTLGAGDFLHGAAAWSIACGKSWHESLRFAVKIASVKVSYPGTRNWLGSVEFEKAKEGNNELRITR